MINRRAPHDAKTFALRGPVPTLKPVPQPEMVYENRKKR
jgi:hypothetical protein